MVRCVKDYAVNMVKDVKTKCKKFINVLKD